MVIKEPVLDALASCLHYTPPELATAVAQRLGDERNARWLEPSVGHGALIRSVRDELGVTAERLRGIELRSRASFDHPSVYWETDFLKWARETEEKFDRIIANPPYLNIAKLPSRLKQTALQSQDFPSGKLHSNANLWYAFLCESIRLLRRGGAIAFILPASWDFSDYARQLRANIGCLFGRVEVHRCWEPMFDGATDGCILLFGWDFGHHSEVSTRYEYPSYHELLMSLRVPARKDAYLRQAPSRPNSGREDVRSLSDVIDIRIGAVTGDSNFFLFDEHKRREWGLPESAFTKVLTRAKHVRSADVDAGQWEHLKSIGERVWLLRPDENIAAAPPVSRYLRDGGCFKTRYKIQARPTWYQPILPSEPHGFISGMTKAGPWLCMNEMKDLTASNTLYTFRFRECASKAERYGWALSFIAARPSALSVRRHYAEGLWKLEPGDLYRIPVRVPPVKSEAKRLYRLAVKHLLRNDEDAAARIALDFLDS